LVQRHRTGKGVSETVPEMKFVDQQWLVAG